MSVDEPIRSLSMDYLNLLINGQAFSDVSFCVEGRVVPAHRCILAARSLFFRRFFSDPSAVAAGQPPPVIPVTSVSYEVFMLMLQFLYTGQVSVLPQKHEPRPNCSDRSCSHSHCSSAVDLALQTLSAARSFGVDQLASLTQKQLSIMVEKASVDDVMRVLLASRKQEMQPLWFTCSHLVAKSGLPAEILAKHLPIDIVASIEDLRLKSNCRHHHHHQQSQYHLHDLAELEEHKIRRMRRALDSSDVELVQMMVMGEGLSLDSAFALHYAVQSSTREVVKALLELGAADVNYPAGPSGKTPLHLAAEMVSPDMVAVLLDHHADPTARTVEGVTPLDVLRGLTSDFLFKGAIPGLAHVEPNKLRLCLELVQSAAMVILREEGNNNNNENNNNNDRGEHNSTSPGSSGNMGGLNVNSRMVYLHLGGRVGSGQVSEEESAPNNMGRGVTHW